MRARCSKCGAEFYWYGGRGHRLADVRSDCCGAPGESTAKSRTGKRGKTYICPVCGRRRLHGRELEEAQTYALRGKALAGLTEAQRAAAVPNVGVVVRLAPGVKVCGFHDSLESQVTELEREPETLAHPEEARGRVEELRQAIAGAAS